jgi:hypothetical protein
VRPRSTQASLPTHSPLQRSVAPRSVDDEASARLRTCGPDVVHYGQKVKLALCDKTCADAPAFLRGGDNNCATPVLHLRTGPVSARHSKHQHVAWTAAGSFADTVWTILTPDPGLQPASEGQPVMRHAPVLLRHAATHNCLACEVFVVMSDFGAAEREVSCHNYHLTGAGHRDSLQAVSHGAPEAGVVKPLGAQNIWRFM